MAKTSGPVPASNGGNRKDPKGELGLSGQLPSNYKNTLGVGNGATKGPVPAGNGGNRKDPSQKIGLSGQVPSNFNAGWRDPK